MPDTKRGGVSQVLFVEDEHDIARLVKHALERSGDLRGVIVGTGAAALKAIMEDPPDLIVLDLNLPFLDGIEVFRILRQHPATTKIPVVMLTARTTEEDRVTGLEMGAEDYITKPFSLRELWLACVQLCVAVTLRPPWSAVEHIEVVTWLSISTLCR